MSDTLTAPGAVNQRLVEIENDLAIRQGDYEAAAFAHYRKLREKEKAWAEEFMACAFEGDRKRTVSEREAMADRQTALVGVEEEAQWQALRAVMRTLEARATIGQSLLRAQTRGA
jgi:hypothetical protein